MYAENSEIIICLDSSQNKFEIFGLVFDLYQSLR